MHIQQQSTQVEEVPCLLCYKDLQQAVSKGTILFYHGLASCKEQQQKELLSLARQGFLAIGVDNVGHGERKYRDFASRFASNNSKIEEALTQAVRDTICEIPTLIDNLAAKGLITSDKIGVIGISMGGYIAYGAPVISPRIQVVTPILGSPNWKVPHADSPHLHAAEFYPVALLAQNAGKDQNVPAHYARDFHSVLQPFYRQNPERLHYVEFPNSPHFMLEEDWHKLWKNVLVWFERFL